MRVETGYEFERFGLYRKSQSQKHQKQMTERKVLLPTKAGTSETTGQQRLDEDTG